MANTPASRKARGRIGQQEVRRIFLDTFEELSEDDIVSRSSGASGTDLLLSPKAQELIPFDIEVKFQQNWRLGDWWKQTKANSTRKPLLCLRKNNHEWLAVLRLEDLVNKEE